ncbi:MAG: RidA family protein [Alphaproteobacteria bacterium]|nr:RidA family protein [Alphaproteobacteria bacterium]
MIKRSEQHSGILHEVVEHHGVLHIAGTVGDDKKADMETQARQTFQSIEKLLNAHGSGKEQLLTALIFITDMKLKPEMNKAWKAWLAPAHLPTRATIGVADLDGWLIEVVVTAAKK